MLQRIDAGIARLTARLLGDQSADGAWRYRYLEEGRMTDSAAILMFRVLGMPREALIRRLAERIVSRQQPDGSWKAYPDEPDGNPAATCECYCALLYAGHKGDEPPMAQAREAIARLGGKSRIDSLMTKFLLAVVGQYPWPAWFPVPLGIMLLPTSAPFHFRQFSGYARVHMAPMLLLGSRKPNFGLPGIPPAEQWQNGGRPFTADGGDNGNASWRQHFDRGRLLQLPDWLKASAAAMSPDSIRLQAARRAEQYMLERIEPDGTLYSYSSSTFLMVFALLAIGYERDHPVITAAARGLESFLRHDGDHLTLQNTTSTVWDTGLASHALQQAGLPAAHPAVLAAGRYLLSRQHAKPGDWQLGAAGAMPGGWGFSDINTINPDVDDTTAALRAIEALRASSAACRAAADRGLHWLLAMQNDDGGWAAFERNAAHPLLAWLPLDGAEDAATDPSSADLTGRALDYLGRTAGLTSRHRFIRRAADWLYDNQESDGSWYARWGICYLYGTWAALTGLAAVGEPRNHPAIAQAIRWLVSVQNEDGGFGESCGSDRARRFQPLSRSTLPQTAWALDALVAVCDEPNEPIRRAADFMLRHIGSADHPATYPTGAGLPGTFYTRYESYAIVWPLLALAHYREKFGAAGD